MILLIIRSIILYFFIVVAMKAMGKRQVGQLQPFELVVILIISEMAAISMQNTGIPITNSIVPIITVVVLEVFLALLNLKSEKARAILSGRPTILIKNGKIMEDKLRNTRININDILEQMRTKDFYNIADVEYVILETNGHLSIIPKSQKRPVQPEDLNIETKYEGLPMTLIVDGKINHENLSSIHLDEIWLKNELSKFDINNVKQVLFASLDTSGNLFFQQKMKRKGNKS